MDRFKLFTLVVAAGGLAWLSVYGDSPAHRRKMQATVDYTARVAPLVKADPRFARAGVCVDTSPAIYVFGVVPTDKARADLAHLVYPPENLDVDVMFNVTSDETVDRFIFADEHPRNDTADQVTRIE